MTPRTLARRPKRPKRSAAIKAEASAREAGRAFARLVRIMATLRSPIGCPWDRDQTPKSLRPFLLEESYEALDAIDRDDANTLCGELGDVLFQCVFQAQIAAEAGQFDVAAAIQSIVAKLIRRHPHVFTSAGRPLGSRRRGGRVKTPAAILVQWEKLKANEQRAAGTTPRVLAGVPRALPALLRAHEIGTRAAAVGFDWPEASQVMDKIEEELRELRTALAETPARAAEELGDLFFALANLARKLSLEPESALREANDKFTARFSAVEDWLAARGRTVHEATLDEMESAWTEIKKAPVRRSSSTGRVPSESAPSRRRSRR